MGWISWLCPGINLKRWLLLFAVGVLLCALGLALFFNYQLMGKAEELLFQMTYLTTGRYSNGLIMTMGVGFLIVGFAIMVYGTRRLISSVVSVVVPDKNGSLMETIFMQRKLTRGPAITVVGGGMQSHPGTASTMFEALYSQNINIHMISTSEIKISVIIDKADADRAVAAIHDAFIQ